MSRKSPSASNENILNELVVEVRRMSGLAVRISQAVADRVGLAPTDLEYLDAA